MIKSIIFDYDGVIVDSFSSIHNVYKIICENLGVICPDSLEEFRKIYGYSYKVLVRNLHIPPEKDIEVEKIFKREITKQESLLFKGMEKVLENLSKKYILFIASYAYRDEVIGKLDKYNLTQHFREIISQNDITEQRIKKSEKIKNILKKYNFKPDEVIYIGDRDIDFDVAKEANLPNIILVDYGWGFTKDYVGKAGQYNIQTPKDLIKAIEKIK